MLGVTFTVKVTQGHNFMLHVVIDIEHYSLTLSL